MTYSSSLTNTSYMLDMIKQFKLWSSRFLFRKFDIQGRRIIPISGNLVKINCLPKAFKTKSKFMQITFQFPLVMTHLGRKVSLRIIIDKTSIFVCDRNRMFSLILTDESVFIDIPLFQCFEFFVVKTAFIFDAERQVERKNINKNSTAKISF